MDQRFSALLVGMVAIAVLVIVTQRYLSTAVLLAKAAQRNMRRAIGD